MAERKYYWISCSLAKISMVAERLHEECSTFTCCSLAKISMVAELIGTLHCFSKCCSLAKISMVAEPEPLSH